MLNELLKDMEKNGVEKYIGEVRFERFCNFICGYKLIQQENLKEDKLPAYEFTEYTKKYFGSSNSLTLGWASFIKFYSGGCHKTAIDTFFKLYKKWHKDEFGEDAW